MPPSDSAINRIRKDGSATVILESPAVSRPGVRTSLSERQPTFLSSPFSIQSMLRNTTEMGDVGLFSIKPSRVPHPLSTRRFRGLNGQQDKVQDHRKILRARFHHDGFEELDGAFYAPSVVSMYQNESPKSLPFLSQRFKNDDHRSLSLSQSAHASRSLSNKLSHDSLRFGSPYIYPARPKRPGYRPTSPTMSELNSTDGNSIASLNQDFSICTSSAASFYARRQLRSGRPQNLVRPVPTLQSPPSPPSRTRSHTRINMSAIRDDAISRPPFNSSLRSSSRGLHSQPLYINGLGYRQRRLPIYYDYTEGFEEGNHLHNTSKSAIPLDEQLMLEDRITDLSCELEDASRRSSGLVKLPVQNSPFGMAPNSIPVGAQDRTLSMAPNYSFRVASKLTEKEAIGAQDVRGISCNHDNGNSKNYKKPEQSITDPSKPWSPIDGTMAHHILTSLKPRFSSTSQLGTNRVASDTNRSCLVKKPIELCNESLESPKVPSGYRDKHRIQHLSHEDGLEADDVLPLKVQSTYPECMNQGTSILRTPNPVQVSNVSQGHVFDAEKPTILSPVPERLMSSHSCQNRFSRILSVDDSMEELPDITQRSNASAITDIGRSSVTVESFVESENDVSASQSSASPPRGSGEGVTSYDISAPGLSTTKNHRTIDSLDKGQVDQQAKSGDLSRRRTCAGSHRSKSRYMPIFKRPTFLNFENRTHQVASGEDPDIEIKKYRPKRAIRSAHLTKELLSTTNDLSFKPFPLPTSRTNAAPPFAFVPSISDCKQNKPILVPELSVIKWPERVHLNDEQGRMPQQRYNTELGSDADSMGSISCSKPWSVDANHRWEAQENQYSSEAFRFSPSIDDSRLPLSLPRFKLKVTRAKSSRSGTSEFASQTASQDSLPIYGITTPEVSSTAEQILQTQRYHSTSEKNNEIEPPCVHARFMESLESRPTTVRTLRLVPPSPGPNFCDVRSFFSDDSSQCENKGSLRERLSQLKAIASRSNSSDDVRGSDRRLIASALGRSKNSAQYSRNSREVTIGMSNARYRKWQMVEKLKKWWRLGEESLRELSEKMSRGKSRQRSESTNLCPGI